MQPQDQPSQADQFINNIQSNPLATAGISLASNYLTQGNSMIKQQFGSIFSFDSWRYYFNVNTLSVLKKLGMILCPYIFTGKWDRQILTQEIETQQNGTQTSKILYEPPETDIHAPDLYIPLMSFITYVLTIGFYYGAMGTFTPEKLSMIATICLIIIIGEVLILKFCDYMLFNNSNDFRMHLSLVSYIFVPILVSTIVGTIPIPYIGAIAMIYCGVSYGFFVFKTICGYIECNEGADKTMKIYAGVMALLQFVLVFFLVK